MKPSSLKTLNEHFSLRRAKLCIGLYKQFMTTKMNVPEQKIVKAFTLHADELLDALGVSPLVRWLIWYRYKHVRVYIGLNDELGREKGPGDFKLFLVPVKGRVDSTRGGKDVIPRSKPSGVRGEEDDFVYDLISPCPNTCDTESPLFNAQNPLSNA